MIRFDIPATVGVPLTVHPVSANPIGSTPVVTAQLYGPVPPLTPIVPVYGVPTVPFGRLTEVRVSYPGVTIVRLNVPLTLSCGLELSVTWIVRFVIPAIVGVPLTMHPVSVNPAGRAPVVMLHRYGPVPPVMSIVAL